MPASAACAGVALYRSGRRGQQMDLELGRMVGRTMRRYLTRHLAPGPISWSMAAHLSGIAGSSFVFCGHCQRPMVGVVFKKTAQQPAEILSLGCTSCGGAVQVTVGVVEGSGADPDVENAAAA
jgi:hypothetical protein